MPRVHGAGHLSIIAVCRAAAETQHTLSLSCLSDGGHKAVTNCARVYEAARNLIDAYAHTGVGHPHQLGVLPLPCSEGDVGARRLLLRAVSPGVSGLTCALGALLKV